MWSAGKAQAASCLQPCLHRATSRVAPRADRKGGTQAQQLVDDTHAKIAQIVDRIPEEEQFHIHVWHHNDDPNILSSTWSILNWLPLWHTPEGPTRSATMPAKYDESQRLTSTVPYDDVIARFHKNEMRRGKLPTHIVTILRAKRKLRHTAY